MITSWSGFKYQLGKSGPVAITSIFGFTYAPASFIELIGKFLVVVGWMATGVLNFEVPFFGYESENDTTDDDLSDDEQSD